MNESRDKAGPEQGRGRAREQGPTLPEGHREKIAEDLRSERLLYGAVLVGVCLELGLGVYIWTELRELGAAPDRSSMAWVLGLSALSLVHLAAARLALVRLGRPASLLGRVRAAFQEGGVVATSPPPELLTVVAVRAAFVADVIAWTLLQFITVYGLVAVVMTGAISALLGFTALSLVGLGLAAPRSGRAERLAEALHGLAAREPSA